MKQAKLLIILLAVLLLACMPTPEEEYVTNRLDGTMLQKISAPAAEPYRYEAPASWQENWDIRGQTVEIDAVIEVSSDDLHPVYTIRHIWFDGASVVKTLQSLLHAPISLREGERSYEELLRDLMMTERGFFSSYDEETGEYIFSPYDGQEEQIQELKALLAETPVQESYIPLSENALLFPSTNQRVMDAEGKKWYLGATISILNLQVHRQAGSQPESWVLQGEAIPGEKGHSLDQMRLGREEAIDAAEEWISRLNRDDLSLAYCGKAREVDSFTYETWEGYELYYISSMRGCIPELYASLSDSSALHFTQVSKDMMYATPWQQEYIHLLVTDEGVVSWAWNDPKEIVATANENIQLMPFDEVQSSIRKLFEYGLDGVQNHTVYIKRIVLAAAITQVPDQGEEAFLVPAWFVLMTDSWSPSSWKELDVLIVNAIDGTFISRFGLPT